MNKSMKRTAVSMVLVSVVLAGCGNTRTDRGVSGAGIGAGVGAAIGAVTGLSVAQGALLGAVAGGATGALTSKDQVNLGDPAWKQNEPQAAPANTAYAPQAATRQTVADIQALLQRIGLYGGSIDGLYGPQTQAAIRTYQQQNGLLVDGVASPALLTHLQQRTTG